MQLVLFMCSYIFTVPHSNFDVLQRIKVNLFKIQRKEETFRDIDVGFKLLKHNAFGERIKE